jgi:hypothetical protein
VGLFHRSRFTPVRGGGYSVRLDAHERALLAGLPDQLEALLNAGTGDTGRGTVRLFPPAYLEDPELDAEFHRLMRDELVRRRLDAVATVRDTVSADRLSAEQLHAWARVLNDVRLVLGTLLDVSEDTDILEGVDPGAEDAPQRVAYVVLSSIVDDAVEALSAGLPPAGG